MNRRKSYRADEIAVADIAADGNDKLLLIDDEYFVSAFAEAGQRRGKSLVCVRCFDPARALRALVLLVNEGSSVGESAGSVGFCNDCYRGLSELLLHQAILRTSKSSEH